MVETCEILEVRCTVSTTLSDGYSTVYLQAGFLGSGLLVELRKPVARVTVEGDWPRAEAAYLVEKMKVQDAAHRIGLIVKRGLYTPTGERTAGWR